MTPAFSVKTMMVICGLLLIAQAMLIWQLLHDRGERRPVMLWTLGSLAFGLGLLLLGLRDVVPGWASFLLGNMMVTAASVLRAQSLRVHLAVHERRLGHFAVWALYSVVYFLLWQSGLDHWRIVVGLMATSLGLLYLAWHAWQLARRLSHLRAARYLAWIEAAAALSSVLYIAQMLAGIGPVEGVPQHWSMVLMLASLCLSALWSSLSYVGMALDRLQQAEQASRDRALVQSARADEAEQQARRLQALMAEREVLSNDRERLLRVMTHEVRQPLHNASGVLQALRQAPFDTAPAGVDRWVGRIDRADEVLGAVRDVLDNVLQAATLLNRQEPLAMQDTELGFLIDFCLLDLPQAQRDRVQVLWHTQLGQAPMAPTLVRLALRNLLRNAFSHGGAAVQVQLRIEERFAPHCLVISVVDNGKGLIESALMAERAAPAVPPSRSPIAPFVPFVPIAPVAPGDVRQGLGLQIVRQVMALHGGRLSLHNLRGAGLSAAMELPMQAKPPMASRGGPALA